MPIRQTVALAVIALAALSGLTLVTGNAGSLRALAHTEDSCDRATSDRPSLGMSDPQAPYDLRFIDEMVMHHRGAIMSAEVMIGDSERPELRDLAQRIHEEQQQQVDQLLAWRAAWYPDATPPTMAMEPEDGTMGGMMGGMMDGSGMMGGMMDGEMADRMFLHMMIPHHQLAIDMAEDVLANAEHEELKALAQEIIDGQSAEIAEMEGYLRNWYGEASSRNAAGEMLAMMQRMTGEC